MKKALVLLLVVAGTASAATINMPTANLGANGYNAVIVQDSSGRGAVGDRTDGGVNGIQFTNGDANKTANCWGAISTANHAGVAASSITSLKIRSWGTEGDGSTWQAPMFMLAFYKAPGNVSNRYAWWVPWTDGTPKVTGSWVEYDAMTDGTWVIPNVGGTYTTFANMLAAYPLMVLCTDADMAFIGGAPANAHSFNVGYAASPFNSNVKAWSDSARGSVDWFEIGINGSTTRYDLGVPEPATLALLGLGGLWLRRRR